MSVLRRCSIWALTQLKSLALLASLVHKARSKLGPKPSVQNRRRTRGANVQSPFNVSVGASSSIVTLIQKKKSLVSERSHPARFCRGLLMLCLAPACLCNVEGTSVKSGSERNQGKSQFQWPIQISSESRSTGSSNVERTQCHDTKACLGRWKQGLGSRVTHKQSDS